MSPLSTYDKKFPEKVYILGSGASLDLLPKGFFDDKFTIGVNKVFAHYDVDVMVVHHQAPYVQKAINMGVMDVFVSKWDRCIVGSKKADYVGHYYVYDHPNQGFFNTDFTPIISHLLGGIEDDRIMIGGTTVINAIGLAVRFGAKEIVLCGCDGKVIDGKVNFEGYYHKQDLPNQRGHAYRSIGITNEVMSKMAMLDINIKHLEV